MPTRSVRLACCALPLALLLGGQSDTRNSLKQQIAHIRELGKRGDTATLPELTSYLKDPEREIRLETVKAIVKIDTTASIDPLVEATADRDSEVRIRATDGIVNVYVPGYVAANSLSGTFTRGIRQVKSFFTSRNDQVVDADVLVRPNVSRALAQEIKEGADFDERSNAALAAGILRAQGTVPQLLEGLRSQDSNMIFECLIALQKIRDPATGPSVAFLAHDLDNRVQATALETIGLLRTLDAAPDVRSAMKNARNNGIRRAALAALAMLGVPGDRETFRQYETDKDAELRVAALEGLGRIREPEDTPALQESFDEANADWRVHLAAAFALVSEGKVDTAEFSPLLFLVENLDLRTRANVARAYLSELVRRADVRASLARLVPQASKAQKIELCSIFGASQSDDVLPVLQSLTRDPDAEVVSAALRGTRILRARRPY